MTQAMADIVTGSRRPRAAPTGAGGVAPRPGRWRVIALALVVGCGAGSDAGPARPGIVLPGEVRVEPTFSTYWGTAGAVNRTVAVDEAGNVFIAGGARDADWPTTTGPAFAGGSADVAIAKLTADGELVWSRLLGGPSEDYAYVSATGPSGELYVAGRAGEGFPTTPRAFDRTFAGGRGDGGHSPTDAFVAKLSAGGDLIYSTYIGGSGDDNARAIHLLPAGKVIVAGGNTTSPDLPTGAGGGAPPVLKPALGGQRDGWVAIVSADGESLEFCTYFGPDDDRGEGDETIRALGVDATGDIWIGGTTSGTDMVPTADAFQPIRGAGPEAFIAKLSADGRRLVYFSWLGGAGPDEIETEGVSDDRGRFYVAGSTGSPDFPTTAGAFEATMSDRGGGQFAEAWVARVDDDGTLGAATLFGGSTGGPEAFFGPVVDGAGNIYATGRFRSPDVPVTDNALQPRKAGPPGTQDAFLAVFDPEATRLLYGSFIGGPGLDHGRHIGIDRARGLLYVIGETESMDLPLRAAAQTAPGGAFLAAFRIVPAPPGRSP